ncbi:uncharacterized protein LOC110980997 [Acanthaster planci]|uniref:Uncharacterized protein LOC110980997 n=1 Tax=Acanthaster planci TaxID=133434 RepID=A0A8B7YMB8_ACAPL|nr:uncharacterized protein LOC110980997 [Acanthaster planci]XP_022093807.1 uncharacterized protein LOC110980997 [Acanthaster planci]
MKCDKCGVNKLSNEFPPRALSDSCEHAALHCIRCVLSHVEQHGKCSQCESQVSQDSTRLRRCYNQLKALFPVYEPTCVPPPETTTGQKDYVSVAMLNGDNTNVQLKPSMTVARLREIVKENLGVPTQSQQLIYNGTEMKEFTDDKAAATLGHYKVLPTTTIYVRRLLFSAPENNLNKVVFDLHWGYPSTGRDFLDATAIIFSGTELIDYLDYRKLSHESLRHSGDRMDDRARTGHHFMNVDLQQVPSSFTHIFFTLSSWQSPTIAKFPNPSLRFYEESDPDTMLCEDTITRVNHSQAIVMCWLSRNKGKWCVYSAGRASNGNSEDYEPLYETITDIIANGL